MDKMRYVEPSRRDEILHEVAEKALPIVVTTRSGTTWLTHKSHLRVGPEPTRQLALAAPLTADDGTPTTLERGELVGVSFRHGHKKYMFGGAVEDLQEYPPAVLIAWPDEVQELQRRVYHRCTPPRGQTVDLRYWLLGEQDRGPSAAQPPDDAYHGTLKDLSVGGVSIQTRAEPALQLGQTLVCHFAPKRGAPPLTIEATLRHREPQPHGNEALGLQFIGLETTAGGRKRLVRLARIVADYQRSDYSAARRTTPVARR